MEELQQCAMLCSERKSFEERLTVFNRSICVCSVCMSDEEEEALSIGKSLFFFFYITGRRGLIMVRFSELRECGAQRKLRGN